MLQQLTHILAIDSIYQRFEKKLFGKSDFETCVSKFKKSIDAGLLKNYVKDGNISN